MDIIQFNDDHIENVLSDIDDKGFDDLAFGAIQLEKDGTIRRYNAAEGVITGRDPSSVVGLNFFTEVAPCTDSEEFRGRFYDGVRRGSLDVLFEYVFDYQMVPTKVKVHMKKGLVEDTYWVFVKRLQKRL